MTEQYKDRQAEVLGVLKELNGTAIMLEFRERLPHLNDGQIRSVLKSLLRTRQVRQVGNVIPIRSAAKARTIVWSLAGRQSRKWPDSWVAVSSDDEDRSPMDPSPEEIYGEGGLGEQARAKRVHSAPEDRIRAYTVPHMSSVGTGDIVFKHRGAAV